MAEYTYKYANLNERQSQIKVAEELGYIMLHDNFDLDWKAGDEPHGIVTFTDELQVTISAEPVRDLAAEIDDLKARIEKLGRIIIHSV